ncbi:MAG: hypothetical protein ACOYN0_00640 [Phycisphaerales bacterium]
MKKIGMTAVLSLCAGLAAAQEVRFNEVMINPPGTDQGNEYIELKSDAAFADLSRFTIIVIEGDMPTPAGVVDQVLPLSGQATGANKLFLWRDTVAILPPGPAPETTIKVQDFVPDLENGANTFLIVEGWTGTQGMDLDTNNDGVLDSTPWTRVVDAFGHREGNQPDVGWQYATQLGGIDSGDQRNLVDGYTPDMFIRQCSCAFGLDVLGVLPGPFFADPVELTPVPGTCLLDLGFWTNSPGFYLPSETFCTPACSWAGDGCFADYNNDGGIDGDDVIAFFADWDAGTACADADASTGVDGDDVIAFFGAWDAGGIGFPGC